MRIITIFLILISGCYSAKQSAPPPDSNDKGLTQVDDGVIGSAQVDSAVSVHVEAKEAGDFSKPKHAKKPHGAGGIATDFDGNGSNGSGVSLPKHTAIKKHSHEFKAEVIAEADTVPVIIAEDNGMGVITYYIPPTMKVGIEYKIQLRIAKKNSVSIGIGLPSVAVKKEIRVGSTMQAVLTQTNPEESAFKIKELNSAVQSIENDSSYTTWEWSIEPLQSGKHGLKLVVVIKQDNLIKDIPVYEDNVDVESSPLYSLSQFVSAHWEAGLSFLMSSILIPIFVWWYNKRKKKKKTR